MVEREYEENWLYRQYCPCCCCCGGTPGEADYPIALAGLRLITAEQMYLSWADLCRLHGCLALLSDYQEQKLMSS